VLRDENARFQYLQLIYSRIKMKPGKALAIILVLGIGAAILPQLCGQTQTGGTLPSAKEIVAKSGGDWTVLQVTIYSSVTFNDVDRAVFTPPPSVRDLVLKGKQHSTS
jgi:hypothetical protein